jgi:hypothetical protein
MGTYDARNDTPKLPAIMVNGRKFVKSGAARDIVTGKCA